MTRDEILAMEPGRELDVLVAEARGICVVDKYPQFRPGCVLTDAARSLFMRDYPHLETPEGIPHCSTEISAALPLAEEMLSALDAQDRTWVLHRDRDSWAVSEMYHDDLIPVSTGAEAPEAITKAYLTWRESEND